MDTRCVKLYESLMQNFICEVKSQFLKLMEQPIQLCYKAS